MKKEENDSLADWGEVGRRILNDEPRDTHARSRREQSIDKRNLSRLCAEGKEEKRCPDKDGHDETYGQKLCGLESPLALDSYSPSYSFSAEFQSITSTDFCQSADLSIPARFETYSSKKDSQFLYFFTLDK